MVAKKRLWKWAAMGWYGVIYALSSVPNLHQRGPDLISPFGLFDFFAHKAAHILEYSIFLFLLLKTFDAEFPKLRWKFLLAFLCVVVFGSLDEFHQSYVLGRNASVFDVWVDAVGSLLGLVWYEGLKSNFLGTRVLLLALCACFTVGPASARSLGSVGMEEFFFSKMSGSHAGENVEVEQRAVLTRTGFPLWRGENDRFLTAGLLVGYYAFQYKNWDRALAPYQPNEFYSARVNFNYRASWRQRWNWNFFMSMGLDSDFKDVSKNHPRINGGAFLSRPQKTGWTFSYGLIYTDNFGIPLVLPGIGASWKDGRNWSTLVRLPTLAEVRYAIDTESSCALQFLLEGQKFQIGAAGAEQGHDLRFSNALLGPSVTFPIYKDLYADLMAGYTLYRRFGFYSDRDELVNMDPQNNFFLRIHLSLGKPTAY